jgi:DNA-binding response OmpR family regulator
VRLVGKAGRDDRFGLRLLEPPGDCATERSAARASHPAQGIGRRPVLYICGEPESRIVLTRIARRWSAITLLVAEGGGDGLQMALERRPRLVVLDAHLPDVDAEELVATLRAEAARAPVPILVLANDPAPRERARFAWAGASAYVTKPLNIAEVDRTVGFLLDVTA